MYTALPFTNEHNRESSDSKDSNSSLKLHKVSVMIRLRMDKSQDINKQMLLYENCVIKNMNPTRPSEANVYILFIFISECG